MKRGFTLIEIVVTIIIIGTLSALAFTGYAKTVRHQTYARILSDIKVFQSIFEIYAIKRGWGTWPYQTYISAEEYFKKDGFSSYEYPSNPAGFQYFILSLPNTLINGLYGVQVRASDGKLVVLYLKRTPGSEPEGQFIPYAVYPYSAEFAAFLRSAGKI